MFIENGGKGGRERGERGGGIGEGRERGEREGGEGNKKLLLLLWYVHTCKIILYT